MIYIGQLFTINVAKKLFVTEDCLTCWLSNNLSCFFRYFGEI